jgi:hypothetical protein
MILVTGGLGSIGSPTAPLRSSATRDRSADRARQGRCEPRPADPLLPKPDRPRSSPAEGDAAQVDAASALSVVVRSGPVETAVNGTPVARPPRMTPESACDLLRPDPTVRPVFGDHRLVGKSAEGSRQPDGGLELQKLGLRTVWVEASDGVMVRVSSASRQRSGRTVQAGMASAARPTATRSRALVRRVESENLAVRRRPALETEPTTAQVQRRSCGTFDRA